MYKASDFIKPTDKQLEAHQYIGHGHRVFFGGARGGGKDQCLTSLVSTPYGWKEMGTVVPGDVVSNPDGSFSTVMAIHPQGKKPVVEVTFSDGAKTKCGYDHLWQCTYSNRQTKRNGIRGTHWKVHPTQHLIHHLNKSSKLSTYPLIPLSEPIQYTLPKRKGSGHMIDPYLMGLLIGDGCLRNQRISLVSSDKEIIDYIVSLEEQYNYRTKVTPSSYGWTVVLNSNKQLVTKLLELNMYGHLAQDKRIADVYKYAPIQDRFDLMAGLIDTDGYIDDRGHMTYTSVSEQLAKDVQWIARSLGCKATITSDIGRYRDDNGDIVECRKAYSVQINGRHIARMSKVPRKYDRMKDYEYNGGVSELKRRIVSIEPAGVEETQCITVDNPNGLYITDDFIVTHNSHFGLMEAVVQGLQHPGLTSVLIRATYNELVDNFIEKLALLYPEEIFNYHYVDKTKTATFSNGSAIKFRACDSQRAIKKVQGIEYQFMVIDEANNFEEATIHDLSGSLRRTSRIKTFIPTLLMTGNPGGLSDLYFKSRFVNPDYKVWRDYEIRHKQKYVFIPAKAADNPHVGEEYVDWLDGLPDHRRLAWKDGSWDVYEGQFFEEWNEPIHVCAPFTIPDHWDRVMSIDLGYTNHPTVCLWGAQDPATGTVYIYREYSAIAVATELHIRQISSLKGDEYISRFFADPSMFVKKEDLVGAESPAQMFAREQLPLIGANNDRVNGWRVVKQWLHWDANHKPKLQIFETCRNLITTLPTLKYDVGLSGRKEDLNTRMQDDAADALRYLLMSAYGYPTASSSMLSDSIASEIRNDLMEQGYSEQFIQERIHDAREGKSYRRGYEEECWVSPRSYYL